MILQMGKDMWQIFQRPTLIKVALEPSSLDRELVLVSEDNSNINFVTYSSNAKLC